MTGIRLGKGLAEAAEEAVKRLPKGIVEARFMFAKANYMASTNGPPESEGTYCGSCEVGQKRYSVYLLPEK